MNTTANFEADFKATIPRLIGTPEYQGGRPDPTMLKPNQDFSVPEAIVTQTIFRTPRVGDVLMLAYHARGGQAATIRRFVNSYQATKSIENLRLTFNHNLDPAPFLTRVIKESAENWIIWAQGGTWFRRPDWLQVLAQTINDLNPNDRVGAIATKFCHVATSAANDPRPWLAQSNWYKGRHLRTLAGTEEPNGNCIYYPNPNFFAISREAALISGIPDIRIVNSGLGIVIGEQLHQNDFKIKSFDDRQQYIITDSVTANSEGPLPWQI